MFAPPDSIELLPLSPASADRRPRHSAKSVLNDTGVLRRCEELSGLELTFLDATECQFPSGFSRATATEYVAKLVEQLRSQSAAIVESEGFSIYGMQIPGTQLLAGGLLLPIDGMIPDFIRCVADELGYSDSDLQAWAKRHSGLRPHLALRLLQSAHDLVVSQTRTEKSVRSTESLTLQLGDTYEEVVLLQDIAQYLRPDIDPLSLAEAVLERVRLISETTHSAYCLRHKNSESDLLFGDWGLDGAELESLMGELLGDQSPRIVVRNHIQRTPLGMRYPKLQCLTAVPIFASDVKPTWLVLANTTDGRELGTEEANLLKSVGGVLSAHAQVVELFSEHEEMVLAFIRSLVTTLDAKDPYTRGHSERVALVAQRIAKELQLSHSEVESVYQAGLLHDIGKIGVDDAVLRKEESLSALEFRKIARHPEVGYTILSELRGIEDLLPGVLHHHERYDGRGYPSKLAGQSIPRIARILAVADSYDAMGSDRPYRNGMKREDVEKILANGAGTQWDPEVVQAFFKARHDIHRIWSKAIERQKGEVLPVGPDLLELRAEF